MDVLPASSRSSLYGNDHVFDVNFIDDVQDDPKVVGILKKLRRRVKKKNKTKDKVKPCAAVAQVVYSPPPPKNSTNDHEELECFQMELNGNNHNKTAAELRNQSLELERLPSVVEQRLHQLNDSTDSDQKIETLQEYLQVQAEEAGVPVFVHSQSQKARNSNDNDDDDSSGDEEIELSWLETSATTNDKDSEEEQSHLKTLPTNNKNNTANKGGTKALLNRILRKNNISIIAGRNSRLMIPKSSPNKLRTGNGENTLAWLGSPVDQEEEDDDEKDKVNTKQNNKTTYSKSSPSAPYFLQCACMPEEQEPTEVEVVATTNRETTAENIKVVSTNNKPEIEMTEEERLAFQKKVWHKNYLQKSIRQKYLQDNNKVEEEEKEKNNYMFDDIGFEDNSIHQGRAGAGDENEDEEDEEAKLNSYEVVEEKVAVVSGIDSNNEEEEEEEDNKLYPFDKTDDAISYVGESFEQVLDDNKVQDSTKEDDEGNQNKGDCQNEETRVEKMEGVAEEADMIDESQEQVYHDLGTMSFVTSEAIQNVYEDLLKEPIAEEEEAETEEGAKFVMDGEVNDQEGRVRFDVNFPNGFGKNRSENSSGGSVFRDLEEEEEEQDETLGQWPPEYDVLEEMQPLPPPPPPPYPAGRQNSEVFSCSNRSDAAIAYGLDSVHDSTVVAQNRRPHKSSNDKVFVIDPKNLTIQSGDESVYTEGESQNRLKDIREETLQDTTFLAYDDAPEDQTEQQQEDVDAEEDVDDDKDDDDDDGNEIPADIKSIFADPIVNEEVPFDEYSALDDLEYDQYPDDTDEARYMSIKEVMDKAERKLMELEDYEEDMRSGFHEEDSRTYASMSTSGYPSRSHASMPQGIISGCIGVNITQEIARNIDKYIDRCDMQHSDSEGEDEETEFGLMMDGDDVSY